MRLRSMTSKQVAMIGCARTNIAPNLASATRDFAKITSLHGATQPLLKQTSRNFKNYESMSLRFCKSSGPMNLPWGKSLRLWTPLGLVSRLPRRSDSSISSITFSRGEVTQVCRLWSHEASAGVQKDVLLGLPNHISSELNGQT